VKTDWTDVPASPEPFEPLGESTRRACLAPEGTGPALQGRLRPPLAKVTIVNRTQGAFHYRDPFVSQQPLVAAADPSRNHLDTLLHALATKFPSRSGLGVGRRPSLVIPMLVERSRHLCYRATSAP
jgi:hypothetical protein